MIQSKLDIPTLSAAAAVGQLVGTVSIALAVEGDAGLRNYFGSLRTARQINPLILQLPNLPTAPGGVLRPRRASKKTETPQLETLIAVDSELRGRVTDACARTETAAQPLLEAFFLPGSLPSRSALEAVFRWGPLIEAPVYRFVARASSTLDAWRGSALGGGGHPPASGGPRRGRP